MKRLDLDRAKRGVKVRDDGEGTPNAKRYAGRYGNLIEISQNTQIGEYTYYVRFEGQKDDVAFERADITPINKAGDPIGWC